MLDTSTCIILFVLLVHEISDQGWWSVKAVSLSYSALSLIMVDDILKQLRLTCKDLSNTLASLVFLDEGGVLRQGLIQSTESLYGIV